MKLSTALHLSYLSCFTILLITLVGCGSSYEGSYYADVKLVSGTDQYLAALGDGKSSETAMTSIYVTCRESSINGGISCSVSKITVDDGSTLDVDILLGSGPFVNKEGAISSRFYCAPYPGKENIQICVRPFEKIK